MEKKISIILSPEFQLRLDPANALVRAGIFPLGPFSGIVAKTPTCFAKGTQILMADGTKKPIESITPATPDNPSGGDVLLSVDGVKTHVVGMLAGPRPEPCIQITAKSVAPEYPNEVLKVLVSMGHTISVDLSRMIHAWFLREGDYVCSVYGKAIIEKVETVDYDDAVWNLYLA